ncbi:SemiSWEET family sugar transporter [Mucilaginibacter antarcticus]|uniref:SemiSWEET family sugar transporter n=1 Tax=Mucilaginibacter antarcticus TaxID=1855725 RepID=A0ABW5XNC5_9SPHI
MDITQIIGLVAGICTSTASIPQIITTVKKKKATDVSPLMFIILLAGNSLWVWYGIEKSDFPIIATNVISVILDLTMLFLRIRYRQKTNH